MTIARDEIYSLLLDVKDPEIPVLSIVDLGIITDVVIDGNRVTIEITPTFVGCPALETIQNEIYKVMNRHGIANVSVFVSFKKAWTSDLISEKGKLALKDFGLAPPPSGQLFRDLEILEHAQCPRCGNKNTEIKNVFGPTLCRSIHYCNDCREAFEQFKAL